MVITDTNFYTSQAVVGNLKIMEANISDLASYGTIPTILPTCETVEMSSNGWILVVRVRLIVHIVSDWLARVLPWNHIMEDSETIATAGVSMVISELANSLVLWTHISAGMRANCMNLQIIPITITV